MNTNPRQLADPTRAEVTTLRRPRNPKGVLLVDDAVLQPLRWTETCSQCSAPCSDDIVEDGWNPHIRKVFCSPQCRFDYHDERDYS